MQQNNYTYTELSVGMQDSLVFPINQHIIQTFCDLSGDHNPIHLDAEFAKKTRFKKIIAPGLLSSVFISGVLGMKMPGPGTIFISQTLNFLAPVYIDDTLTIVVSVIQKLDKNRVVLECKCLNQNNQIVTQGELKVLAPLDKI